MRTIILLSFTILMVLNLGCEPKDQPPQSNDFSCIKLYDEQGQDMGIHGSCTTSNDWENIALNTSESAFLNFSDTISLTGTVATQFTKLGIAPNPVTLGKPLFAYMLGISSNPSVKVKIAVVDESLKVITQFSVKTQSSNAFALFIDPAKFESGKYYRMYYRVSATGAPSLFEGYGNFLVCKTFIDGVNTTIESDCL